jgi:hypothetical protein
VQGSVLKLTLRLQDVTRYPHMFLKKPNEEGTRSTVLCYLIGRITSPIAAYVITITIFIWGPSLEKLARSYIVVEA